MPLRTSNEGRNRARATQPSDTSPDHPCAYSYVCSILTVAGLVCDMAREDRGDEGLPPRVRLELREMPCGTPCAAAPERSAVAHWWEDRWPVPPVLENVTRRCAM